MKPIPLRCFLELLTVEKLKSVSSLITTQKPPTTKAAMIEFLERLLLSNLKSLWEKLTELEQAAVGETLHATDGLFDPYRFKAQYGGIPENLGWEGGYRAKAPLLRIFLFPTEFGFTLPLEHRHILAPLTPKPAEAKLFSVSEVPKHYDRVDVQYQWKKDDEGITVFERKRVYSVPRQEPDLIETTVQVPIIIREMELAAQRDLQSVMSVIAKGRVVVSEKTRRVSATSAREIVLALDEGDFFELEEKVVKGKQEVGPIRAFAWPLMLQSSGLAQLRGKKLELTKAGLSGLNQPAHETIRHIWQKLLQTTLFDEFNRVEAIRGQSGRGAGSLTSVPPRRAAIASVLSHCPPGGWIEPTEFSRFMQALSIHFEVCRDPWSLYISDREYGSLGYRDSHTWNILQGRYILCFLFEYAATLGLIDVAYVPPAEMKSDYMHLWGADYLSFLSRYDGLLFFRLTPLGAYCLGISNAYRPARINANVKLSVMPGLTVTVIGGAVPPRAEIMLEPFAERESPNTWRLSKLKSIEALESGRKIEELQEFLEAGEEQPLPQSVESFFKTVKRQSCALRHNGLALLVDCADESIADNLAEHKLTRMLCKRVGATGLAVPVASQERFRKAARIIGYGMPVGSESEA